MFRCHCFRAMLAGCLSLLTLSVNAADVGRTSVDTDPVQIEKFYFLFHPVCWRSFGEMPPAGADKELWASCYQRELVVNEQQKQFISDMPQNAVLIVFPIGESAAMRELEEHASQTLGRRCLIVRRQGWDPPAAWAELKNPIEQFLLQPNLPGREEFISPVPPEIRGQLESELREAWQLNRRPNWNTGLLEVAYYSRMCAEDIRQELVARKLEYDPATVRSEAFGEGFEQCAMTWKQMLVPYLGLSHPAENRFDLSVSGAPFLVNATLLERIELPDQVRLYLWRSEDDRLVAMYARAWCRMRDPAIFSKIPVDGMRLEVRETHNQQLWPDPDAAVLALTLNDGHLAVPVFNGIRRDHHWLAAVGTADEPCYLIADGISVDDFRERLVKAAITPLDPPKNPMQNP